MQLRNGKQTQVDVKEQFISNMYRLMRSNNGEPLGEQGSLPIFVSINEQTREMLVEFDNTLRFHATVYRKTAEFTCILMERSYTRTYSNKEKTVIIQLLSEMCKTREMIGRILWENRTNANIQEMMETDDGHSNLLYRCLRHIISDDWDICRYIHHQYTNREYNEVELYDWYLLPNFGKKIADDLFIRNADRCFGEEIHRYNRLLWNPNC